MNKKVIGFLAGIAVAVVIMLLPLSGMEPEGQRCLALSLMTVVWWATNVAQSGFVGGFYLIMLIVCKVATPDLVFKSWYGSSTMWLVMGCIYDCGGGKRLRSWRTYCICIYQEICAVLQRNHYFDFCADVYHECTDTTSMAESIPDYVSLWAVSDSKC